MLLFKQLRSTVVHLVPVKGTAVKQTFQARKNGISPTRNEVIINLFPFFALSPSVMIQSDFSFVFAHFIKSDDYMTELISECFDCFQRILGYIQFLLIKSIVPRIKKLVLLRLPLDNYIVILI